MSELKKIVQHAGTVLIGQLAVMAYGVTDTIVAGRFSSASLAALSVGSAIYVSVFVALLGVLQAMLPIWAELNGGGKTIALGQSFRQALYLCGLVAFTGMVILLNAGPVFQWAQVPETLRQEAQTYLDVLAWTLPPALLFRMFSTLNQSLGWPVLVTWLQIGSLAVKVPLSIWFAFGGWGLDARGAVGCAWATLVVNYALCAVAVWQLKSRAMYRPFGIWQRLERPDWKQIAGFAKLGIPSALAVMVEVTSFTLMALFIARMGDIAAASHQIAINLTAVLYMMPLAISIAASSRISFWLGAGEPARARQAVWLGVLCVAVAALSLSALLFFGRAALAPVYTHQPEIVALAIPLLAWVAAYHVFDALQTICLFSLRCFKMAFLPFLIYAVFLWGGGLGGGYLLAYQGLGPWPAMHRPDAFWITSVVALVATTLAFSTLLFRKLRSVA